MAQRKATLIGAGFALSAQALMTSGWQCGRPPARGRHAHATGPPARGQTPHDGRRRGGNAARDGAAGAGRTRTRRATGVSDHAYTTPSTCGLGRRRKRSQLSVAFGCHGTCPHQGSSGGTVSRVKPSTASCSSPCNGGDLLPDGCSMRAHAVAEAEAGRIPLPRAPAGAAGAVGIGFRDAINSATPPASGSMQLRLHPSAECLPSHCAMSASRPVARACGDDLARHAPNNSTATRDGTCRPG
jgi:hypothetical protein